MEEGGATGARLRGGARRTAAGNRTGMYSDGVESGATAPDEENLQPLGPGDDSPFPQSMRLLKACAAGNIMNGLTMLLLLDQKLELIVFGKTRSGPGFEMRKIAYGMIMYVCIRRVVEWSCRRYGLWLPTTVGVLLLFTAMCLTYYA